MQFFKLWVLFCFLHLVAMEEECDIVQNSKKITKEEIYDSILGFVLSGEIGELDNLITGKKIDVNMQDELGETFLHRAAFCYRESSVKYLLKQANINLDIKDNDGFMPIYLAIMVNEPSVVILLLKAGANCYIRGGKKNLTPIQYARQNGYQSIVDAISEFEDKKQAVFSAVKLNDRKEIINLAKQITFFLKDEEGNNPLHYLINYTNNSTYVFGLILWICPKLIFTKNYKNICPIDLIIVKGEDEILKKIIQLGFCNKLR